MNLNRLKILLLSLVCLLFSIPLMGCGNQNKSPQEQKIQVKAMKVINRDVPIVSEYAGKLVNLEEVKIQSKVTGNVVEKYIHGGQYIERGQLLYKIDSRQYESALLQAQAASAEAEVKLNNARLDLARYETLLKDGAIAERDTTTQIATVRAYEAVLAANEASVKLALENLADTKIYAPISGQLGIDDVAIGTFVTPGQTTLVTISNPDPIFAQFSISESDYLHFMTVRSATGSDNSIEAKLTLADGTEYPFSGEIVAVDRELSDNTGALIMKAIFPNPNGLLISGMFARVKIVGETVPNAILIPQRAVQQLLDKTFVMCVGMNNKSEARTVELGKQIGSYFIVKSGVKPSDVVVVEGLTNLREGMDLEVRNVTASEMGFTLNNNSKVYQADDVNVKSPQ